MRRLITTILVITWLCSYGQTSNSKTEKVAIKSEIEASKKNNNRLSQNLNLERYIYSDTIYPSSTGKGITIQNSFPKGGMIDTDGTQYSDSSGKEYGFAVFWTRIINETHIPIELNIDIPADSFAIFTPPASYLRLLLPRETMALDKLSSFNYGLTDIKSYLNENLDKASLLQKSIDSNEEHIFYVVTLLQPRGFGGTPRAAMILKGQDLYYRMGMEPYGSGSIPIGKIAFKNESGD